jgi:hypothetical protein
MLLKGDDADKKEYPGPSGWGLGIGPTTLPRKTRHVKETEMMQNRIRSSRSGEKMAGSEGFG